MTHNPIICAIDTPGFDSATSLTNKVHSSVGAIKLGLEFFTRHGTDGIQKLAKTIPEVQQKALPLFLDLKFHDIPNTVAGAVRATQGINAFMMTVHAAGGTAMLKAAKEAANELKLKPMIIAVTVLTSLDQDDMSSIGITHSVSDQVRKLADLAQKSGVDGVVCSPHEIEVLRKQCGKDFKLVVPGIRPAGSTNDDQKRVMTPKEAMDAGASYLVIGRPITEAENPQAAAESILNSL